jgi:hypothetical protein
MHDDRLLLEFSREKTFPALLEAALTILTRCIFLAEDDLIRLLQIPLPKKRVSPPLVIDCLA